MDFLALFGIYVAVVLTCIALVCKYSGHQQTPLGRLFDSVTRVVSPWIPQCLKSICYRAMHRLFHQSFVGINTFGNNCLQTPILLCQINNWNNLFLNVHLLLEIAVYAEFSFEIFGFCLEMGASLISLCVPYILLALKSYVFYLCCSRDPGTLTKGNHTAQLKVYQYDEKLFQKGIKCPTCDLVKPARSKHCRVCNRCVQRFDHHCVWVNNCIGAQNTRYFLLYLVSVCAMAGDISVLIADMLVQTVVRTGLLHAQYLDEQGQQQPVGPLFIIQHLFLTFPRIVFMLGFLVFVFFLLAGYSLFHMYLALVNQTSNEWFKGKGHRCQHCYSHSGQQCRTTYNPFRGFYHRGILKNLGEILWPLCPVTKKDN